MADIQCLLVPDYERQHHRYITWALAGQGWRRTFATFGLTWMVLSTIISICLILWRRNYQPLRSRGWVLLILGTIGGCTILDVPIREMIGFCQYNCDAYLALNLLFTPLFGLPQLAQVLRFHIKWEYEGKKDAFGTQSLLAPASNTRETLSSGVDSTGKIQRQIKAFIRKDQVYRRNFWFLYALGLFLPFAVLAVGAYGGVYHQVDSESKAGHRNGCSLSKTVQGVLVTIAGVYDVVALISMRWVLRDKPDAFGIAHDLKIALAYCSVGFMIYFVFKVILSPTPLDRFDSGYFIAVLPLVWQLHSVWYPAFQTFPWFQACTNSLYRVIRQKFTRHNGEEDYTRVDEIDLKQLLSTELGNQFFGEHLRREFSIENLQFYNATEKFKDIVVYKLHGSTCLETDEDVRGRAYYIYSTYLLDGSPLQVNVSDDSRRMCVDSACKLLNLVDPLAEEKKKRHRPSVSMARWSARVLGGGEKPERNPNTSTAMTIAAMNEKATEEDLEKQQDRSKSNNTRWKMGKTHRPKTSQSAVSQVNNNSMGGSAAFAGINGTPPLGPRVGPGESGKYEPRSVASGVGGNTRSGAGEMAGESGKFEPRKNPVTESGKFDLRKNPKITETVVGVIPGSENVEADPAGVPELRLSAPPPPPHEVVIAGDVPPPPDGPDCNNSIDIVNSNVNNNKNNHNNDNNKDNGSNNSHDHNQDSEEVKLESKQSVAYTVVMSSSLSGGNGGNGSEKTDRKRLVREGTQTRFALDQPNQNNPTNQLSLSSSSSDNFASSSQIPSVSPSQTPKHKFDPSEDLSPTLHPHPLANDLSVSHPLLALFSKPQSQVFRLMKTDSLPRFVSSGMYASYVAEKKRLEQLDSNKHHASRSSGWSVIETVKAKIGRVKSDGGGGTGTGPKASIVEDEDGEAEEVV